MLCVNFVASVSFFSKWEDIVLLLSHAPQKKLKKNCISLLFDMLSHDPAAITLRVCRVNIEEGLYEVRVGLEVN